MESKWMTILFIREELMDLSREERESLESDHLYFVLIIIVYIMKVNYHF
jgi:hypothetical protein